jgi:hypothetical protein
MDVYRWAIDFRRKVKVPRIMKELLQRKHLFF